CGIPLVFTLAEKSVHEGRPSANECDQVGCVETPPNAAIASCRPQLAHGSGSVDDESGCSRDAAVHRLQPPRSVHKQAAAEVAGIPRNVGTACLPRAMISPSLVAPPANPSTRAVNRRTRARQERWAH